MVDLCKSLLLDFNPLMAHKSQIVLALQSLLKNSEVMNLSLFNDFCLNFLEKQEKTPVEPNGLLKIIGAFLITPK